MSHNSISRRISCDFKIILPYLDFQLMRQLRRHLRGECSNSQFGDQKGCGVCVARMSAAGSCRQAPKDGFTAFLDRHTPHPNIGETAQTGNCWGEWWGLTITRNATSFYCSLLTAHCSLLTAHCSLLTAHCSLLNEQQMPPNLLHCYVFLALSGKRPGCLMISSVKSTSRSGQ